MRALVVSELGPDYRGVCVQEVNNPAPGPEEVLVRIRAAAVNFPDLLQTRGEYQHKPALPFVAGMEAAGEVVEASAASPFKTGDRVVGAVRPEAVGGSGGPGAFAEYAVMASARAMPPTFSFAEAAAFGTAYLTAYVALVRRGQLQPGDWVLVHGAAGGVGLAAVDLARALGAKVIAAGASDESVRCIAFGGRLLSIGFASGRIPTLPVNMSLIKGFSLVGVRAGEYGRRYPAEGRENLEIIWRMATEGKLRPRVHAEIPLDRWREAYDLLGDRKVVGKAVITP